MNINKLYRISVFLLIPLLIFWLSAVSLYGQSSEEQYDFQNQWDGAGSSDMYEGSGESENSETAAAEESLPFQDENSFENPDFTEDASTEAVLPPELLPGLQTRGVIDLDSGLNYVTYRLNVSPSAVRAEIRLSRARADLDLYVRYGTEILDYGAVDAGADSDDFNEELVLSRFGDAGLYDGEYYLDVVYQHEFPPFIDGKQSSIIDFDIRYTLEELQIAETISAGDSVSGTLLPEEGMMKLYAVRAAGWDSALRIDVADTTGDVDLFVSRNTPAISPENAEFRSESLLGRESLVISRETDPSYSPGTYYILVLDQVSDRFPVMFSLHTGTSTDAPGALMDIPPVPDPDDPLQHAVGATVEVIGENGRGSGCMVSRDGYLLTNWHVVKNGENQPSAPVYVAATIDQHLPPKELFSGSVVRYDEDLDLALIKIDAGRYGQPLPGAYRFPFFEFTESGIPRMGEPISILGYPANGGIGSRVSVTLTRGIVSGFEASPLGVFIKTDGEISFGNSGGAVFNAFGELVGLPVSIYTDGEGKLGFILPVSMIPSSWLKIISGTH